MKLTFKQIQDWFGDRGFEVKEGDFLNWGNDDKYIYWIPNNKKCHPYLASEDDNNKNALYCVINSMWCEVVDDVPVDKLPNGFKF